MRKLFITFSIPLLCLQGLAAEKNSGGVKESGARPPLNYTAEQLEKLSGERIALNASLQDLDPLARAKKFSEFAENEIKSGRLPPPASKDARETMDKNARIESLSTAISFLENESGNSGSPERNGYPDKIAPGEGEKAEILTSLKPLLLERLKLEKDYSGHTDKERLNALEKWDKSAAGKRMRELNQRLRNLNLRGDLIAMQARLRDLNSEGSQINIFFEKMKDGKTKRKELIESLNRQIKITERILLENPNEKRM